MRINMANINKGINFIAKKVKAKYDSIKVHMAK